MITPTCLRMQCSCRTMTQLPRLRSFFSRRKSLWPIFMESLSLKTTWAEQKFSTQKLASFWQIRTLQTLRRKTTETFWLLWLSKSSTMIARRTLKMTTLPMWEFVCSSLSQSLKICTTSLWISLLYKTSWLLWRKSRWTCLLSHASLLGWLPWSLTWLHLLETLTQTLSPSTGSKSTLKEWAMRSTEWPFLKKITRTI